MLIADLQQKVLSLQTQLNATVNNKASTLIPKLNKFFIRLTKKDPTNTAKQWEIVATWLWENTINHLQND